MSNSVVLSIGNTYQRLPEHQAKLDRSRTYRKVHDWVLYVDVPNDHPGDKEIIDRVTFRLGSSFVPSDFVRHCPVPPPPHRIRRVGGVFVPANKRT
jgi:transcription initiation factor IIF auxiliary subunit